MNTKTSFLTNSIMVAFATNNATHIDAHFGSAKEFHIYEITRNSYNFYGVVPIMVKDTDSTVKLLNGVDIVYFVNIGPAAAAKIINNGIFPIKYKESVSIDEELSKLMNMLGTNPPPFIKKICEQRAS
ncbi:MAG: NifB/NifX family molybdenum-iron cluster-binding protein [Sulfurovaceae bacterium]|nr:NifB/NifX family molybdenum-iron cluster-binding protein [Sulfurovaceae bacterium]